MIVKWQPACPCCGQCTYTICVGDCVGGSVGEHTARIEYWDGSAWVLEADSVPVYSCGSSSITPRAGVPGRSYRIKINPVAPAEVCYEGEWVEFDYTCNVPSQIAIPMTLDGNCDCDRLCCPGLPQPLDTECFEISDGISTITMENIGSGEWLGCKTYTVDGWKYCAGLLNETYSCYQWDSVTVPVLYHLTFNCPAVTLNIIYPAGWNDVDSPNCDAFQAGASLTLADGCTEIASTGWSGSGCSGSGRSPEIVCNNHWRLVGDLSCAQFRHCAGFSGGSATRPTCLPHPDYGTPTPIRVIVGSLTAVWAVDCDAANPYEAEVTLDLGIDSDPCNCGATGAGTFGVESENHPLSAVLGTTPTITVTQC